MAKKDRLSTSKHCPKCRHQVPLDATICPECSEDFKLHFDDTLNKRFQDYYNSELGKKAIFSFVGAVALIVLAVFVVSHILKQDTLSEEIEKVEDVIEQLKPDDYGERHVQYGKLVDLVPTNEEYKNLYSFSERQLLEHVSSAVAAKILKGLGSFEYEAQKAMNKLNCLNDPVIDRSENYIEDFTCVLDQFNTTTWTVKPGSTKASTSNIIYSWQDHVKSFDDVPAHVGKPEAFAGLKKFISLYVPDNPVEVQEAFWGDEDQNLKSESFDLQYSMKMEGDVKNRSIVLKTPIKPQE